MRRNAPEHFKYAVRPGNDRLRNQPRLSMLPADHQLPHAAAGGSGAGFCPQGGLRDGFVDAAFVGVGAFYSGPRAWPIMVMAAVVIGAILKERGRSTN